MLQNINRFLCFYLWNHHNWCVFDGLSPNVARALLLTGEELQYWGLTGAKGIAYLLALVPSMS